MSRRFQVEIDLDKCVGSRICVAIAPNVFALNADGQASVLSETEASIEIVRMAAEGCPVSAIKVKEFDEGRS